MSKTHQPETYQVFISYSHRDNVPPPYTREAGWVTHFDRLLEHFLREWHGEPSIWRDDAVRGSDLIDETILTPLPHARVLITVISPNYLKSEWCARELEEFCRAAESTGVGVQVSNKMRIFKVLKVPLLKGQTLSPMLARPKGFEFYDLKDKSTKPYFYGPDESTEEAKRFFRDRVGDVAWDVIELLDLIEQELAEQAKHIASGESEPRISRQTATTTVAVYLAEATPDLTNQRDNVKRDLLHRGYRIVQLGNENAALQSDELEEKIKEDLESCDFSIHLVGNDFGSCPPDETSSIVEIQDEVAARHADHNLHFQRLIWIPDGIKPQHTSQRRFVNALLNSNFARNTELLRRNLENFKTVIQDKTSLAPEAKQQTHSLSARTIGIVCDRLDSEWVGRLDDCLFTQGYDVVIVDGSTSLLTEDRVNNLSLCDGIVIYMDTAPLFWVQSRLQDISGLAERTNREFLAVAVYVDGQRNEMKERFRTQKAVVIKNFEDGSDALRGPIPTHLLQPFIEKLDDRARGKVS